MSIKYDVYHDQKLIQSGITLEEVMSGVTGLTTHICSLSEQPLDTNDHYTVTETQDDEVLVAVSLHRRPDGAMQTNVEYEPAFVERIEERHNAYHADEAESLAGELIEILRKAFSEDKGPPKPSAPFHYN